jgi:peptide/nickel transport system ATP-binding protein
MLKSPKEGYTKSLWSVRALEKAEAPSEDIVLSINNVDAAYNGSLKVLHDVNIKIPRGRTVAVVGESGSGKSTTARVITGLLPPMTGSVQFNGEALPTELKDRSKDQLQRIQMIYQSADTAMNPRQTIAEIIGRPLEFYHDLTGLQKQERILELLKMIELDESFYDRLPSELSGGQKQRVAIARAMASRPKVLLADEPTGALDTKTSYEVMDLIQKINQEGKTILVVTHELDIAKMCKRIVQLKDGVIIKDENINQVLASEHV